jgi:hypothetical protein
MIKGIGDMTGTTGMSVSLPRYDGGGGGTSPMGGGGSAQDGLGQIDSGASTVRGAISTAANALGGGGGSSLPVGAVYKKGGSVKGNYVSSDGKINLGSNRVSTSVKNKTSPKW